VARIKLGDTGKAKSIGKGPLYVLKKTLGEQNQKTKSFERALMLSKPRSEGIHDNIFELKRTQQKLLWLQTMVSRFNRLVEDV